MVAPEIRTRDSARVLVVDDGGRVLLLRYVGPDAAPEETAWLCPGGRVDDGETLAAAAARELWEETGHAVSADQLGDVVAVARGAWTDGGEVVVQVVDSYYLLRVSRLDVDTSRLTEQERDAILGHRWWSADELRETRERVYPTGLAGLLERLLAGDIPAEPVAMAWQSTRERVRGCLVGGAVGDALGYPVEFDSLDEIRRRHGPAGLSSMVSNLVTDDTQMTLFTAEGLLRAEPGSEVASVHRAYLRWLETQSRSAPPAGAEGIAARQWLYARRAPGNACLSGLRHTGPGPVNPESKGCGTVMRSAPFGLLGYGARGAFELAADCSRLTHGHPTAAAAAGAFAAMVDELMSGTSLAGAVDVAMDLLGASPGGGETAAALDAAARLAGRGEPSAEKVESLGEGWVAEEALAIAVYCALVADYTGPGLLLAVNHSGDSDSTGAICGNLLGAERGMPELPRPWVYQVEGLATITAIAAELADRLERIRPTG